MIKLIMQTGLRVREAVAVKYTDIEKADYIHIQRMVQRDEKKVVKHTKTDYGDRIVLLTDTAKELIEMARRYQKKHGIQAEYDFPDWT